MSISFCRKANCAYIYRSFLLISAGLGEWFRNTKPAEATQDGKLSFIVAQGTCLDRSGRLYIKQEDDGKIWVGGRTLVCIKGSVVLP